ncbi:MAG: HupE/UreJ family protein [Gammaproteobacteria bacterium]|nr:HupE/UreJ family protein [Gammaproteobacteria bacterium]
MERKEFKTLSGILLLFYSAIVPADDARPAYLELKETQSGAYDVTWKRPEIAGKPLILAPVFPANCRKIDGLPAKSLTDMRIDRFQVDCGEQGVAGGMITMDGLAHSARDVIVKLIFLDYSITHILRAEQPSVLIQPTPDNSQVMKDYLWLGIEHIHGGIDHLLFILALIFLVPGLVELIKAVTAFTLSHSLTLVAAVLGWVSIPLPPVEACIALSILFLAVEMVHKLQGHTSITISQPWLAAMGFGLIHGFGFAGALSQVGLPPTDIPLALLFFNLGVELGQLLFVVPIYAFLKMAGHGNLRINLEYFLSYGIGTISVFWLIERIRFF